MKLKSIEIENFRSIYRTTRIQLDPGLTVILGPNNEGKSNLLKAIAVAMECLKILRQGIVFRRAKDEYWLRLPAEIYHWETDFPLAAQSKDPDGESTFSIEFLLSADEQARFRKDIGSKINHSLPLEIAVGQRGFRLKVKKQGKSGKFFETKTREIAQFVSGLFDFQYIPAIRPSDLSLRVVGSLLDRELSALAINDEYIAALKTIENLQKPVFDQLAKNVQIYLRKLLPSVKTVKISSNSMSAYRTRFQTPKFIVDDGSATELDAKGDGIKSLVAISLMRATKASSATGDLVIAIEEPESHLHPDAIRQLATVLKEMAKEHQVIVTTHSPLLVARNRIGANIIVSNSRANPAKSIREIRDSLGVRIEDSLSAARYMILVEGKTDTLILTALFRELSLGFAQLIESGAVAFGELEGAPNVGYKIATLRQLLVNPILVLDDDKAGRDAIRKAKKDSDLDDKYIFSFQGQRGTETELEDIVAPEIYWSAVEQRCGVVLDPSHFCSSSGKWSDRLQSTFEAAGKPWGKSVESIAKSVVAECASRDSSNSLSPGWRPMLKSVVDAIVSIVEADT